MRANNTAAAYSHVCILVGYNNSGAYALVTAASRVCPIYASNSERQACQFSMLKNVVPFPLLFA
jgi:hypothetical protein